MPGPLAWHGEPIKLSRKPNGEVADVDHLLHFAERFLGNLPRFPRHQSSQIILLFAERHPEPADQFAAMRSGDDAPELERVRPDQ